MLVENYQRFHQTLVESYIDQEHILMKKDHQKQFCHTIFSHEFYINQEYKKMQKKHSFKALSHIF